MLPNAFKTVGFDDPGIDKFETNVAEAVGPLLALPIAKGVLLEGVTLNTAAPVLVAHGLQRAPKGYFVVRKTLATDVWDGALAASLQVKYLNLYTSVNCTVSLWVF